MEAEAEAEMEAEEAAAVQLSESSSSHGKIKNTLENLKEMGLSKKALL